MAIAIFATAELLAEKKTDLVQNEFGLVQLEEMQFGSHIIVIHYLCNSSVVYCYIGLIRDASRHVFASMSQTWLHLWTCLLSQVCQQLYIFLSIQTEPKLLPPDMFPGLKGRVQDAHF